MLRTRSLLVPSTDVKNRPPAQGAQASVDLLLDLGEPFPLESLVKIFLDHALHLFYSPKGKPRLS